MVRSLKVTIEKPAFTSERVRVYLKIKLENTAKKMPAHQRNGDISNTRAVCWGSHGRGAAPTFCITNSLKLQMVCFD